MVTLLTLFLLLLILGRIVLRTVPGIFLAFLLLCAARILSKYDTSAVSKDLRDLLVLARSDSWVCTLCGTARW